MEKEIVFSATNISKRFGGVIALNDVSFNLFKNEILAVVGANGAGKSTLMKIIAGALSPDTGTLVLNGKKIEKFDVCSMRESGIEMVYQDLALVKNMNAPYNLFVGRLPTKFGIFVDKPKMEKKTIEVLEKLQVKTIQSLWVDTNSYSGGQQQAIAIGRAIAWGREIVILDEPTAALGVLETEQVMNTILELKKQGSSIILISHNLEHVYKLADRILVIRNGLKVREVGIDEITIDELITAITTG